MSVQSGFNELTTSILVGAAGIGHTLGKKTEALGEVNDEIIQNEKAIENAESEISNLSAEQEAGMPQSKDGKYRDAKGRFTTREKAEQAWNMAKEHDLTVAQTALSTLQDNQVALLAQKKRIEARFNIFKAFKMSADDKKREKEFQLKHPKKEGNK